MTFSDQQIRHLKAKLDNRRVKSRQHEGRELSFVEGWYVIAEANRIFGFDGWDRLSHSHQLLYERRESDSFHVAYSARARVIVRAGPNNVVREGSGFGSASNTDAGAAHELALKAAETDATKRALATFGNRFGLSLYDKDQVGVTSTRPAKPASNASSKSLSPSKSPDRAPAEGNANDTSPEADADGVQTALIFLKATRERVICAADAGEVDDIVKRAAIQLQQIRDTHPDLRNRRGIHLADAARSIADLRRQDFARNTALSAAHGRFGPLRVAIDKSRLALATAKRFRDEDHLKRVAALPCLVCGRTPSQAHHIRFAQPRGMGLKVSDEFTVPLCAIDHGALHRAGDERSWWAQKNIDPLAHAHSLWSSSRSAAAWPTNDVEPGLAHDQDANKPAPEP